MFYFYVLFSFLKKGMPLSDWGGQSQQGDMAGDSHTSHNYEMGLLRKKQNYKMGVAKQNNFLGAAFRGLWRGQAACISFC